MNLYEDLPPISGDSVSSNSVIGNAWSNVSLQLASGGSSEAVDILKKEAPPTKVSSNQETNRTNESNSLNKPPSNKPLLPSSLLFKPRQATTVTQKQRPANDSTIQKVQTSTNLPSSSQHKTSEQLHEYFNSNTSFDVDEAYDPRRPNDYIAFCDEREENKRLERLAEENKKKLEELEYARQALERKRREAAEKKDYHALLHAVKEDDISIPFSGGVNMSRGRGRGVANLPAWITQQMNMATNQEIPTNNPAQFADAEVHNIDEKMNILQDKAAFVAEHVQISGIKRKATYISKPSRVLLLKNMVKTSEIDKELKTELSLEFKKFGDVISMVVYAVDKKNFPNCPEHEEVRIFVHYERQDYAIRAWKDMNGRYFGGRKVSVEYFPESKFVSSELEPGNDEW